MMKYFLVFWIFFFSAHRSAAQQNRNTAAGKIKDTAAYAWVKDRSKINYEARSKAARLARARKTADLMKDSLYLDAIAWRKVFDVNLYIESQKEAAFKSTKDRAKLSNTLQALEKERLERYRTILTPGQYQKYGNTRAQLLKMVNGKSSVK